ncbi:MAG TPA: L-aspartate oxidase [Candidatus Sumerlaeota bacterium]|nr:L-aspartate oxidase [Candidatus Sumerlaeota bacterium]HOR27954.1 L-aspartate oxidase [Candidatus Sumerlaeota bacterium]HPK03404.1 L-aspartate oxidase [Candidatus Sumerlaeota bacterium]
MQIEVDVLIIGAGIAGAAAALTLADAGAEVLLLHRSADPNQTNTRWAQGGIIYTSPNDSPELLARDIEQAGAGLTNPPAARLLAEEGPRLVKQFLMDRAGVPFDRGPEGELDITEEGAHSVPRIIHCQDRTGWGIQQALYETIAREPRITVKRGWTAIDLLTLSHHSREPLDRYEPHTCVGAYVLDRDAGQVVTVLAHAVVLATGGLGGLFLHTTNPPGARGDGIAMAYRAGARLTNLEFIQFHPTALYKPPAPRFLISESMRGEGARLITRDGEEFMRRFHPQGSLAPRDVVARSIHEVLLASGEPCVYLDLTYKDSEWIKRRFPTIYHECLRLGIDITQEPIPVVPAAHYSCGGVHTDLWGRTTINRLWAVGEVACTGLHGANRLASTSLLEGLVMGHRAAEDIAAGLAERRRAPWPVIDEWVDETEPSDPALILQDWLTIKYTMWNYVGLARTQKRLKRAYSLLRELQQEVEEFYARTRIDDDLIGLRNGVQAALAVLYAAMQNHVSRGCHYLDDAPESRNRGAAQAITR